MIELVQRTPEELRRLLATEDEWNELFAEIATVSPTVSPQRAVDMLFGYHQITSRLALERMTEVDRAMAERYVAVLLQYDLAYKTPRLSRAAAIAAAAAFLHPFGTAARFYASVRLTPEVLAAKEVGGSYSLVIHGGVLGSTCEEGLIAFDPVGVVGALFVGDED